MILDWPRAVFHGIVMPRVGNVRIFEATTYLTHRPSRNRFKVLRKNSTYSEIKSYAPSEKVTF